MSGAALQLDCGDDYEEIIVPHGDTTYVDDPDAFTDQLNQKYCVVQDGGKTFVLHFMKDSDGRDIPVFQRFNSFKEYYLNQKIIVERRNKPTGLADYWLNHAQRRTYEAVVFEPKKPREFDGKLNLWRGFGVEPRQGDWTRMQRHIVEVLADGDEAHAKYITKWAAWTVKNPDKQAEVALVFKGGKGSGKGVFGRAMRELFGQHGKQISSSDHLTGRFNAHLRDCCLLFADEALWPGDKAAEGSLKRLITEDTLFIEPKGRDTVSVPNRLHVVMASNESWVVPASHDERRYAVFKVSDRYRRSEAYFVPLYAELDDNGGLAAMLHELLAMDLGDWHPRQVPNTKALLDQQMESLDALEAWWLTLLQDGELPGAEPDKPWCTLSSCQDDQEGLFDHARRTVPRLKGVSEHALGNFLRDKGCKSARIYKKAYKGTKRGWEFPQLDVARKAWEERFPAFKWDDPDLTAWREPPRETM